MSSVRWSPKSSRTCSWTMFANTFVNSVHQNLWLTALGEHCSRTWQTVHEQCSPNCSKRGLWWTLFTNLANCSRTVFTKMLQKGYLVNTVHELWQTVHEQCSPNLWLTALGEHCSRTWANCSRTVFTKDPNFGELGKLFANSSPSSRTCSPKYFVTKYYKRKGFLGTF